MAEKSSIKNGRVIGVFGPRVEIQSGQGIVQAAVGGRLKHGDTGKSLIAVGDYVDFSQKGDHIASITRIHKRAKIISRPAIEKEGMIQIIVSNVDRMVIVTSTAHPDFKPGVVDRFLVIAFKEDIKAIVVLNKIDLANAGPYGRQIEVWREIGCDILLTSAKTGENIEELRGRITTGTSVVVGHSGVGKSSLINRLNPDLRLKIGNVSSYTGKGKHVTSRVNLFRLFSDGWVADTPGLRDLGLAGVTRRNLHLYYPEFEPHEAHCQFTDCVHVDEPSCAVKDDINKNKGSISPLRYQNYLSIYGSLDK